ncbi:hypothetical protein B0A49_00675 [Cryomyces minteri]|uniref:LYR motif-containing protein 2 n=1 Tax=Cryomyces minteri TaxID=331657 RepID=A0A4U0Y0M8_9PEZI|nr:hypothetical protein B0A49_00675 [Cryomyces minteri]
MGSLKTRLQKSAFWWGSATAIDRSHSLANESNNNLSHAHYWIFYSLIVRVCVQAGLFESMQRLENAVFASLKREYTSAARRRTLRDRGPLLSLDQFLQRQRVLSLWRQIVRATNKIPAPVTRKEMRDFARGEFTRNKDVTDLGHIRYLISTGKTEFDSMKRYVEELAM